MRIILASSSPRRKDLLEKLNIPVEVMPSDVDESVVTENSPYERVETLSKLKANVVADATDGEAVIIGADTVVTHLGRILNKPEDRDEAVEMLRMLQGKHHTVYTGMTIIYRDENGNRTSETYVDGTDVEFTSMSEELIKKYVETGEFTDKAGGYAIQGKGSIFILNVNGNYDNVVGLPIPILYKSFREHGIDITDFWK